MADTFNLLENHRMNAKAEVSTKPMTKAVSDAYAPIGGAKVAEAGREWATVMQRAESATSTFAGILFAQGLRGIHIDDRAENTEKRPDVISIVRGFVIDTLPAEDKRVILATRAELSSGDKAYQDKVDSRVRARLGKLRDAMFDLEDPEGGSGKREVPLLHAWIIDQLMEIENALPKRKKQNISVKSAQDLIKGLATQIEKLPRKAI